MLPLFSGPGSSDRGVPDERGPQGVAVTPLQLAVAYASIANGGELIEPSLVREIRDADGEVRYRHTKRFARRVMSPAVARTIRTMLVDVVEHGTAVQADLSFLDTSLNRRAPA